MKEDSMGKCKYLMGVGLTELQKACNRVTRHDTLIINLIDPKHKIGKALRSIEWLDEAENERTLNAYGSRSNLPWNTVKGALEEAYICGDVRYVTLMPDKMELHNAGDELILEFASKKDYYHLIVELNLIIDRE